MAEGAYVSTFPAFHGHHRTRKGNFLKANVRNIHPAGLTLHRNSLTRKVHQLLATLLLCRIHRRNLIVAAHEAPRSRSKRFLVAKHFPRGQHRPGHVLAVGFNAEKKRGAIGFTPVGQKFHQLGRAPETHGQNTLRCGIKGSRVPYSFLPQNSAEFCDNVVRGKALFLPHIQDTVKHAFEPPPREPLPP